MRLIEKSLKEQCVEGCQSLWFKCAVEVLKNNDVNRFVFAAAIRELLKKGRGKNRNVIIVGPANFAKDILFDRHTPIFATSKEPIEFVGKRGAVDEKETEMMNVRWNIFSFKHQISKEDQKDLLPCARCFA